MTPSGSLKGMYDWAEDGSLQLSDETDTASLWLLIQSYAIPRRLFPEFREWALQQDWFGRWMPDRSDVYGTLLGEWPWHASARLPGDELWEVGNDHRQIGKAPSLVRPTWADYYREGDGSFPQGAGGVLPAAWLATLAGLQWKPSGFAFQDSDLEVVAFDPSARDPGPSVLLYRADALQRVLDEHGYSLVWTVLGEKQILRDALADVPEGRGRLAISGVGALESGAADVEVMSRNILHPAGM